MILTLILVTVCGLIVVVHTSTKGTYKKVQKRNELKRKIYNGDI